MLQVLCACSCVLVCARACSCVLVRAFACPPLRCRSEDPTAVPRRRVSTGLVVRRPWAISPQPRAQLQGCRC
eukprot:6221288-Prymnesium_polylepis.1